MRINTALFICLFVTAATFAAPLPDTDSARAPRVGVVLGGGGARGFAHLGALQELERLNIPISCIAGTSAGALIGGIYASGMSLGQLADTLARTDWDLMTSGKPLRADVPYIRKREDSRNYLDLSVGIEGGALKLPRGAINAQSIELYIRYLTQHAPSGHFDALPIPFRAVATNLENGDAVVFDHGDLATALRASMAVPGIFDAVEVDGKLLVDGLLARNLPVSDVKGRCADVVIAIDVGEPLKKAGEIRNWVDVLTQSLNLGVSRNVAEQKALLDADDVLLRPALGDTSASAFADNVRIAEAGRAAVRQRAAELARFSVDPRAYQLWKASLLPALPARVDALRIAAPPSHSTSLLEQKLALPAGGTGQGELLDKLQQVFAEGDYDRLTYSLQQDGQRHTALVTPLERSTGPDVLRLGISMEGASGGDATFSVLASHRRSWINEAGATWFNEVRVGEDLFAGTEFYQPLGATSPLFVALGAHSKKDAFSIYTSGHDRLADLSVRETRVNAASGVALGRYGQWRLGLFRGQVEAGVKVGDPALFPVGNYHIGGVESELTIDQVDNPRWPRRGYALSLRAQRAVDRWTDPAYADLTVFDASADYVATSRSDLTLRLTGKWRSTSEQAGTIVPLGGFLNLSGYQNNELLGQKAALARLMGYWRIASLPSALGSGVYVGASLEAGRVWETLWGHDDTRWLPAGTLFLGADSLVGPLFFGVGTGRGGRLTGYFYLGADY